ncbi:ribosome-binding protein 1-like isoform X16 [Chiloscyllium plagiosum]|uniref:ribosome-binding protein 1-like isoform X16 n=1 Tax=Chiloscyllium plagiosum TaxID=36176 RepID=UPI001CB7CB54|nr:ribosome-binding protein 1-like isoform X16 [Chiloscyllium plagiosum]
MDLEMFQSPLQVLLNENVHLKCKVTGYTSGPIDLKRVGVQWKLDGETEVYSFSGGQRNVKRLGAVINDSNLLKGDASLFLPRVQIADEGRYTCIVFLTPESAEQTSEMKVSARPSVSLSTRSLTILSGLESSVRCDVTGFYPQQLKISWIKVTKWGTENVSLQRYTKQFGTSSDKTFYVSSQLNIKPTMKDDGDKYRCVVVHSTLPDGLTVECVLTVRDELYIGRNRTVNELRDRSVLGLAIICSMVLVCGLVIGIYIWRKRSKEGKYALSNAEAGINNQGEPSDELQNLLEEKNEGSENEYEQPEGTVGNGQQNAQDDSKEKRPQSFSEQPEATVGNAQQNAKDDSKEEGSQNESKQPEGTFGNGLQNPEDVLKEKGSQNESKQREGTSGNGQQKAQDDSKQKDDNAGPQSSSEQIESHVGNAQQNAKDDSKEEGSQNESEHLEGTVAQDDANEKGSQNVSEQPEASVGNGQPSAEDDSKEKESKNVSEQPEASVGNGQPSAEDDSKEKGSQKVSEQSKASVGNGQPSAEKGSQNVSEQPEASVGNGQPSAEGDSKEKGSQNVSEQPEASVGNAQPSAEDDSKEKGSQKVSEQSKASVVNGQSSAEDDSKEKGSQKVSEQPEASVGNGQPSAEDVSKEKELQEESENSHGTAGNGKEVDHSTEKDNDSS